ncbi:hypothetical protein A8H36_24745 [Burkholderia thailandensis]|nr:hypothetical protein A8H36_24745 [Burkholderia thailandensis]
MVVGLGALFASLFNLSGAKRLRQSLFVMEDWLLSTLFGRCDAMCRTAGTVKEPISRDCLTRNAI